jgi:hypothetical protein
VSGRFRTGIDGPFGVELTARQSWTDYSDTTDPDLLDNDRQSLDATARFRLNPALTARLVTGLSRLDEDDLIDTSRRNAYYGFGVEVETARGLTVQGDLLFDTTETRAGAAVTSDDDGLGFELGATQEVVDGAYGVSLASRIDESGRRTSASISRSFDMPTGDLALSFGVVDQENSDTELTTRLTYTRQGPDNVLRADVIQSPSTNDGDAVLNTSIRINYGQEINAISSWDAGVSYGSSSVFGATDGNTRASATVAYTRDLTQDWNMRAGVELTRIEDDSGANRSSNTVFLSVGRDFTLGF